MKLKARRFSNMGAQRPSSGIFAEEVVIDAAAGEYSTITLFCISHAFRGFEIVE